MVCGVLQGQLHLTAAYVGHAPHSTPAVYEYVNDVHGLIAIEAVRYYSCICVDAWCGVWLLLCHVYGVIVCVWHSVSGWVMYVHVYVCTMCIHACIYMYLAARRLMRVWTLSNIGEVSGILWRKGKDMTIQHKLLQYSVLC